MHRKCENGLEFLDENEYNMDKVDVSLTMYKTKVKELTENQSLLGGMKIMAVKVAINGFGRIGRLAVSSLTEI